MVTVLGWVYLVVMVAVPTMLALLSLRQWRRRPRRTGLNYAVLVELHAIKTRMKATQLKLDIRRDGAYQRRRLHRELDEFDKRRRGL